MASLNVSQDEMIDILIGHANVRSPLNIEQSAPDQDRPYQQSSHAPDQGRPYQQSSHAPDQGRPYQQSSPAPDQGRPYQQSSPAPDQGRPYQQSSHAPDHGRPYQQSSHAPDQGRPYQQSAPDQGRPYQQSAPAPCHGRPYQQSYTELHPRQHTSSQPLPPCHPCPPPSNPSTLPSNASPPPSNPLPLPSNPSPLPSNASPLPSNVSPLPSNVSPLPSNVSPLPSNASPLPSNASPLPINPSLPQRQMHNQYICPGCQKAILYTNRSSLVSLLLLHKEKCRSSHEYRYMCLDCHNPFKTIVQLQAHENICRPNLEDNKTDVVSQKLPDRTSKNASGVIQNIQSLSNQHLHHEVQNSRSAGIESVARNQEHVQTFIGVTGEASSIEHEGFNRDDKFATTGPFYNPDSTNTSEFKMCTNQSSAVHNHDSRQNYQQTPPSNRDYKMPLTFYHPDSTESRDDSFAGIQSMPQQQQPYGPIQDGSSSGGRRGIESKCQHDRDNVNQEDSVLHSMSGQPYQQPQHLFDSCKDIRQDCPQNDVNVHQRDHGNTNIDQKIFVRESWTQTSEQPVEADVEELLDEISPAGRRRRTCTRRIKVYNEKELAEQREHAEIEMLRLSSGRKRAKVIKKELKVLAKEKTPQTCPPKKDPTWKTQKSPKKNQEKKGKTAKAKEQDLAVPMNCQQCTKTFTRYSVYTKHFQLFHERAMCQFCGKQCIRRKLKSHEASHRRNFKCPYPGCAKVLNSNHRLVRHTRIHTGEKPFTCDVCNKPFAGKENMVKHKKRVHDGEKPYQCRYCGRKFADTGRLKYHEGTHTRLRPTDYRCKFCGRGYKSHVGCYLHERTHTGKTVKCQYCGKAFMAKEHLKRHEYIHTGNYPFRCGNCQRGFKDNSSMKKHKCLAVL